MVDLGIIMYNDWFFDIENFESFVRTQKKIENFYMSNGAPEFVYDRVMTHIFGLESLRKVEIFYVDLINELPEMRNDYVKTLNFHSCNSTESLKQYLRIFPKLTDLRVSVSKRLSPETILLIKNMESLEELRFLEGSNPSCSSILQDIKLPNLRKFEIYAVDFISKPVDGDIIKEFIKQHPNVIDIKLDITVKPGVDSLEILETLCDNMKNLKQIKMRMKASSSRSESIAAANKMIEEKAPNLETIYLNYVIKQGYNIFKLEKQGNSHWVQSHLEGENDY